MPQVDNIIDVGVAYGTPWLYEQFPDAELLLVDPVEKSSALEHALKDRAHTFVHCALGAESGVAQVNVNLDQPSRSSLLKRTTLTQTDDHYRTTEIEVETLDRLAKNFPTNSTYGLKVDTEGYELEVLRGATNTLKHCSFVICEASIQERFKNSYRFEDLVCFMRSHGFGVEAILTAERDSNNIIRFVDIIFVPRYSN